MLLVTRMGNGRASAVNLDSASLLNRLHLLLFLPFYAWANKLFRTALIARARRMHFRKYNAEDLCLRKKGRDRVSVVNCPGTTVSHRPFIIISIPTCCVNRPKLFRVLVDEFAGEECSTCYGRAVACNDKWRFARRDWCTACNGIFYLVTNMAMGLLPGGFFCC